MASEQRIRRVGSASSTSDRCPPPRRTICADSRQYNQFVATPAPDSLPNQSPHHRVDDLGICRFPDRSPVCRPCLSLRLRMCLRPARGLRRGNAAAPRGSGATTRSEVMRSKPTPGAAAPSPRQGRSVGRAECRRGRLKASIRSSLLLTTSPACRRGSRRTGRPSGCDARAAERAVIPSADARRVGPPRGTTGHHPPEALARAAIRPSTRRIEMTTGICPVTHR